jgi:hypothetical protein
MKMNSTFTPIETQDPKQAVKILFEQALPAVIFNVSSEDVENMYNSLKDTWSSEKLINGLRDQIEPIILTNLRQTRRNIPNFRKFKISADFQSAQIDAFTDSHFIPVRVWRVKDTYYACGNSDFHVDSVTKEDKQQEKRWWQFWK